MDYVVICLVALIASCLTFFSGFGLGTLLLPAFAFFFPVDQAIALTAVVHFLNGLFKLLLVGQHADRRIVWRFGVPAILAAMLGAWLLLRLSADVPTYRYELLGQKLVVTPVKVLIGLLLLLFAAVEVIPSWRTRTFGPQYLVLGGIVSGFLGGISGMQGAARTAFLARAGLPKETFVATGVSIGCLIDCSRLGVYATSVYRVRDQLDLLLLGAAVIAAFTGAIIGNYWLKKVTITLIQRVVAAMLALVAIAMILGVL